MVLEMSGGVLTDEWLDGRSGGSVDSKLELMEFTGLEDLPGKALDNPFFPELSNVYDELELESLVNGVDLCWGETIGSCEMQRRQSLHARG